MKSVFYRILIGLYQIIGRILSRMSTTDGNAVVINCNQGRGYLCNPKYIVEALNRLYPGKYRFVMLVKRHDESAPTYVEQVGYHSLSAMKALASARYWIFNARAVNLVPKRADQIYIHTWHASLAPKIVERDAGDKLPVRYRTMSKRDGAMTDLMFADNDFAEAQYKRAFWYTGPVLRCGVPRNRPLIMRDENARARTLEVLGISKGTRVCLYAPTFRNSYSLDVYNINPTACCRALRERFGGEWVFAWRLHPNFLLKGNRPRIALAEGEVDATAYPDAQEVIAASDVIISDYSSTMDDCAFTDKPGFMFATDIDEYMSERGFYYPLTERPYPVSRNMDELIRNIAEYDPEEASRKRAGYFKKFGVSDDGRGDELIARLVNELSDTSLSIGDVLTEIDGHYYYER